MRNMLLHEGGKREGGIVTNVDKKLLLSRTTITTYRSFFFTLGQSFFAFLIGMFNCAQLREFFGQILDDL